MFETLCYITVTKLVCMNAAKFEFNKRVNEVISFFQLLEAFEANNPVVAFRTLNDENGQQHISQDHIKILKASAVLLLYNLIEASISKIVSDVFEEIKANQCSFESVSDKIQKLWIDQFVHDLREGNFSDEKLKSTFNRVITGIFEKTVLYLDPTKTLKFGGNLDETKIHDVSNKIGCKIPGVDGRSLKEVKRKRNQLAHGDSTFCEIGKDLTLNELKSLRDSVFRYLEEVFLNFEDYISNQGYLRASRRLA